MAQLRSRMHRPSPAMMVALLALFVALGGSAFAASYVITKSSQIKDGAVTGADVKNSSLTSSDVKNSSLTSSDVKNSSLTSSDVEDGALLSADFKAGQLPTGPSGPLGPKGDTGATGPQGPKGEDGADAVTNVVVHLAQQPLAPGETGSLEALCQPGEVAVGGGVGMWGVEASDTTVRSTSAAKRDANTGIYQAAQEGEQADAWSGAATNGSTDPGKLLVHVICVSSP